MASNIPVIVQGNSFNLAIPLQIYVINDDQMELQDYTPDPTDQISIQLKGSRRNYTYTPTSVTDNVCMIALGGYELADNYSVVVSIVKANGQRLRSFRTDQFFIVESSDDLTQDDIIQGLEENVIYLNSSIFVAGAAGRGISSITKTGTSGLVDTYTIYYTDNTTSTFQVTNGANGQAGAQGADGVGITSIEKTATAGKVDTYTITLSNGNTSTFEVTNGLDGVDLGLANIVNDLTTGGEGNALSAEMGKELKGMIDGITAEHIKLSDIIQCDSKWSAADNITFSKNELLLSIGGGAMFKVHSSSSSTKTTALVITDTFVANTTHTINAIVEEGTQSRQFVFRDANNTAVATPSLTINETPISNGCNLLTISFNSTTAYSYIKCTMTYSATGSKLISAVCWKDNKTIDCTRLQNELLPYYNNGLKGECDVLLSKGFTSFEMSGCTAFGGNMSQSILSTLSPWKIVRDSATQGTASMRWHFTLDTNHANLQISMLMEDDGTLALTGNNPAVYLDGTNTKYSLVKYFYKDFGGGLYALVLNFGAVPAGNYNMSMLTGNKVANRAFFCLTVTDNDIVLFNEEYFPQICRSNKLAVNQEYNIAYLLRNAKICVYGASIDATGGYWERVANELGVELLNLSTGGGTTTWRRNYTASSTDITRVTKAWSCTKAEKEAMLTSLGVDPAGKDQADINIAYDVSVLGNLDADLFVLGVLGGNDDTYTNAYTLPEDDNYPNDYPRESVYGAIKYVLDILYAQKPTAKVIIMGSHNLYQSSRKAADRCFQRLAEDYGIPYLKWSQYFNLNNVNHLEYCSDDRPHWKSAKTMRVTKTILKVLADIKPYLTEP